MASVLLGTTLWLGTTSQVSADEVTATESTTNQATASVTDEDSQPTTTTAEPATTSTDVTSQATPNVTASATTNDQTADNDSDEEITAGYFPTEPSAEQMSVVGQNEDPVTSDKPVTIGNGSKEYRSADPMVAIALQPGMTAPSDWILTKTANIYYVAGDSADISINNGQDYSNIGIYDVTLSAAGLGRLQALNPDVNITANSVATGKLTVTQTVLPEGTFIITTMSKAQDNDEATDPDYYYVNNRFSKLVMPSSWEKQSDGSYKVPVGGDGIDDSGITSQATGSYLIKLTDAALQELYQLNHNYLFYDGVVAPSYFKILSSDIAIVNSVQLKTNSEVTGINVMLPPEYQVPSDWVKAYQNGNGNITWSINNNLLDKYFDTTSYAADNYKISDGTLIFTQPGSYELKLKQTTIDQLNQLNPTQKQLANGLNISTGKVIVSATSPVSYGENTFGVNWEGSDKAIGYPMDITKFNQMLKDGTLPTNEVTRGLG